MRLPEPLLGEAHPLNLLRELHAALEAVRDRPDCSARLRLLLGFLLSGLDRYDEQASTGVGLDAAFGLRTRSGPSQWWNIEQRAHRDRMLREIVRTHYADIDLARLVPAILSDLALLDRQHAPPPGSVTAALARAAAYAPIPRTPKGLRAILREIKQTI